MTWRLKQQFTASRYEQMILDVNDVLFQGLNDRTFQNWQSLFGASLSKAEIRLNHVHVARFAIEAASFSDSFAGTH